MTDTTNSAAEAAQVSTVTCYYCEEVINEADTIEACDSEIYCMECHDDRFRDCDNCEEEQRRNDMYEYDGDWLCNSCYDSRRENRDDDDEDTNIPTRTFSNDDLPAFQSNESGKIITSQRIFSAEIEAYYNSRHEIDEAARLLPRPIGVAYDGSLDTRGVEFQTPKMRGENGEKMIEKICKVLSENDFYVNRSTGLHIHLDGDKLMPKTKTKDYPNQIISLWSFYVMFEDVFLSFLPRSRRKNNYCNLIRNDFHIKEIMSCNNLDELEALWYRTTSKRDVAVRKQNKYDNSRYMGVNLHSLFANNHLEIRYHSGTLNATKILEWINVHQAILDTAAVNDYFTASIKEAEAECTLEGKTQAFFDLLNLPDRAREYFKSRQAMFTQKKNEENVDENDEAAMIVSEIETPVCAA